MPPDRRGWDLGSAQPPWEGRVPIYDWVAQRAANADPRDPLPDHERMGAEDVPWADGARDGVMSHHAELDEDRLRAKQIVRALSDVLADGGEDQLAHLNRLVVRGPVLGILDPVLEEIVEAGSLDAMRFHALAVHLVRRAADREMVKLGVGMLGILVGTDERECLLAIGSHEEFTLYVAVALASSLESPDEALWDLARSSRGWGRIHAVERLAATQDPEIRAWMLREGFRNDIMDEYLAFTCATAGGLAEALAVEEIDDALLDGAGRILSALLHGGPAEDIEDYDEALAAVESYLSHLVRREDDGSIALLHLHVIEQLRAYLAIDEIDDEGRTDRGWTKDNCARLDAACTRFLARPGWSGRVAEALESPDEETFVCADQAAELVGLDPWEHHVARLEADSVRMSSWHRLAQTRDVGRVNQLVELARRLLPIADIATGAEDELGLGDEFALHDVLGSIVRALAEHPGLGVDLVEAALRSPVVRVRHGAARTIDAWPDLDDSLVAAVRRAVAEEPNEELASSLRERLEGHDRE